MGDESTLYSDGAVLVTATRVVVAGTTHLVANVAAVSMSEDLPDARLPIAGMALGAVLGRHSSELLELPGGVPAGRLLQLFIKHVHRPAERPSDYTLLVGGVGPSDEEVEVDFVLKLLPDLLQDLPAAEAAGPRP